MATVEVAGVPNIDGFAAGEGAIEGAETAWLTAALTGSSGVAVAFPGVL